MLFSSLIFIYAFLPLVLVFYYLLPKKLKNTFLFLASFVFFAWGGVSYSFLLLFSITMNYFVGRGIGFSSYRKQFLRLGVVLNLSMLGVFKYTGFFAETLNAVFRVGGVPELPVPHIILPIGISFYTFQAMSYLFDVYRKEVPVQKNFINLGLYISLFPQLIAGPIVRYHDIDEQLKKRESTFEKFSGGVIRFSLGLAKKVLIANNMAIIADYVFALPQSELNFAIAWIGIVAYSLQIYYDFAGYSDMAIGLSALFGFKIPENFNFPYVSRSIREFWQRWHISLSSWLMKYLFLPTAYSFSRKLKQNRYGTIKADLLIYMFAAAITFVLCGFWHGAAWNFVAWGAFHGVLLIIEKIGFEKWLKKRWKIFSHLYLIFAVLMGWVLFRAESFHQAAYYYKALFSFDSLRITDIQLIFKLNIESFTFLIIAVLGAGSFFILAQKWLNKLSVSMPGLVRQNIAGLFVFLFVVGSLLLSTTYLVNNSYNPFIYFRF